jgi:hypothetical protein
MSPRHTLRHHSIRKRLIKAATGLWRISIPAAHAVLTARWCAAQNLMLPDDINARFHPSLTFGSERAPALIWPMHDLRTAALVGIVRYFLADDGTVLAKRMLGRTYSTAIMLTPSEDVLEGLHIAPSVESALKAMASGLRPVWALTRHTVARTVRQSRRVERLYPQQ